MQANVDKGERQGISLQELNNRVKAAVQAAFPESRESRNQQKAADEVREIIYGAGRAYGESGGSDRVPYVIDEGEVHHIERTLP